MRIIYFIISLIIFPLQASGKLAVAVIGEPEKKAEVESALLKSQSLQPVEREKIDRLLGEIKLGQSGVLKEGTYTRAGEISGAEYFVMIEKDSAMRLVHVQSSKVLGAWKKEDSSALEDLIGRLETEKTLKDLFHLKGAGTKDFLIDITNASAAKENGGAVFGEQVKIELMVKSKKHDKAYLTMLYYGQDGTVLQIFPNKHDRDNRVDTNKEISIPGEKKSYSIVASPPAGTDTILLIASDSPVGLQADSASFAGPYMVQKKGLKGTKGLEVQLNKNVKYGISRILFDIREK
ncbi:MAG TPA: DUF4384 domain-containing protein [Leptospiraceae bacterium]|nr:DUF4384 domain-containing protein [Leptospiraceae bacterium]HMY66657.1 DUF4384 domain-containing protein [Leptospiraceae bacterium]HNF13610.1 DUF4384 domain-containing protein [Leptospiraceae bacterium]HNF24272.1 DUF4384 domain-containing protein [Leptospiraceae bacterium]HNI27168.1 DUF4384 domain-containing protein [Leptospiraceae bacterium]